MNKQPYYHCGQEVIGDEKLIVKAVKKIPTVIKTSVELFNGELLFTATSDISTEANKVLKRLPGVRVVVPIDAEPGSPEDLM